MPSPATRAKSRRLLSKNRIDYAKLSNTGLNETKEEDDLVDGLETQALINELCSVSCLEKSTTQEAISQKTTQPQCSSQRETQSKLALQIKECIVRLEKRDFGSEPILPLEPVFTPPPFKDYSKIKIIRRIPKAARLNAAKELTRSIGDIVTHNDMFSWFKLFSFAPCCLSRPTKKSKNSPSLATIVNKQIAAFEKDGPKFDAVIQPDKKTRKNR